MKNSGVLPESIKKEIQKRKTRRILATLLWYALWGVSLWRYYAVDASRQPNWILPIFVVALLLLPLWIFRLWEVVLDRPFTGEIVRIKYRMMSDIPIFQEGLDDVERNEAAILFVRRGRRRAKKLSCRRLWRAADRCYKVGDTVRHMPLVPLPQNLSHPPEGGRLCLMCGVLSEDSHAHCAACGREIF